MIPDKIYIRHYWMPGELDDEWRLKPVEDEKCEEYIRKDALLEWAKEQEKVIRGKLKDTFNQELFTRGTMYNIFMDYIESL